MRLTCWYLVPQTIISCFHKNKHYLKNILLSFIKSQNEINMKSIDSQSYKMYSFKKQINMILTYKKCQKNSMRAKNLYDEW